MLIIVTKKGDTNGRNNRALDGFLGGKLEDLGSAASMALHLLLCGYAGCLINKYF
jgi:hypothetical protein